MQAGVPAELTTKQGYMLPRTAQQNAFVILYFMIADVKDFFQVSFVRGTLLAGDVEHFVVEVKRGQCPNACHHHQ